MLLRGEVASPLERAAGKQDNFFLLVVNDLKKMIICESPLLFKAFPFQLFTVFNHTDYYMEALKFFKRLKTLMIQEFFIKATLVTKDCHETLTCLLLVVWD